MNTNASETTVKPLRVWIPMLLLPLMIVMRYIPEWVDDGPAMIWMSAAFGPFLIGLVLLGWWLFASRAAISEKMLGLIGLILVLVGTGLVIDPTMREAPFIVITIPMALAAFALVLVLLGGWLSSKRTVVALILAAAGAGYSACWVNEGVWGDFSFGLRWRWQQAENFAAWQNSQPGENSATAVEDANVDLTPAWSGFRGNRRDGVVEAVELSGDWAQTPPRELWRIPVGAAWSSFAVSGSRLFTQEQRDQQEVVVCYDAATGKEVWANGIASRFFEALGGLGPRATPTVAGNAVYALGAEGLLRKLDANKGTQIWQVDLRTVAKREPPMWGFSCSPLVYQNLVIVHAAGKEQLGVVAFDIDSGEVKWTAAAGEQSYGSLQVIEILGQPSLGLLSETGILLLDPATGQTRLDYAWPHMGYRALQPIVVDDKTLVIPTGLGAGTRMIQVSDPGTGQAWQAEELWTSRNLKPDFNDVVMFDGHLYGFDNAVFTCIDLKDGSRKWKGGRYGKGQVVVLPASKKLIVLSEQGEVALLEATPQEHRELAKFKSLPGKTWNHPVLVGDRLFVRNAEEAVCYQLEVKQ